MIRPGDRYLDGVVAPGTDLVNETAHWRCFAECAACATRYGRGDLITEGEESFAAVDQCAEDDTLPGSGDR